MIVPSRDPYYAATLDYDDDEEAEDLVEEKDRDSHASQQDAVTFDGDFVYERQRQRHEWNKRGSIVEEIVFEREQAAIDSLRKYGRVFGRWQHDARRTYFLPSYIK